MNLYIFIVQRFHDYDRLTIFKYKNEENFTIIKIDIILVF